MIADMFSNKKSQPIVTKLFTRVKTTIFFFVFIKWLYSALLKKRFKRNLSETRWKIIITIDDKFRDDKLSVTPNWLWKNIPFWSK